MLLVARLACGRTDPHSQRPDIIFNQIYSHHGWAIRGKAVSASNPLSGDGSTIAANNVTCAMLLKAVQLVAADGVTTIRILDAPVGDWTWMPSCLLRMVASLPETHSLIYQGLDIVDKLVHQLNQRNGSFLAGGRAPHDSDLPYRIQILPFALADATNATTLAQHPAHVIVCHNLLIHTPNKFVLRAFDAWNAVPHGRYVVTDQYPRGSVSMDGKGDDPSDPAGLSSNHDLKSFGKYREINLHAPPFSLVPAVCTELDTGMCAQLRANSREQTSCRAEIELLALPVQRTSAAFAQIVDR